MRAIMSSGAPRSDTMVFGSTRWASTHELAERSASPAGMSNAITSASVASLIGSEASGPTEASLASSCFSSALSFLSSPSFFSFSGSLSSSSVARPSVSASRYAWTVLMSSSSSESAGMPETSTVRAPTEARPAHGSAGCTLVMYVRLMTAAISSAKRFTMSTVKTAPMTAATATRYRRQLLGAMLATEKSKSPSRILGQHWPTADVQKGESPQSPGDLPRHSFGSNSALNSLRYVSVAETAVMVTLVTRSDRNMKAIILSIDTYMYGCTPTPTSVPSSDTCVVPPAPSYSVAVSLLGRLGRMTRWLSGDLCST
mmetsp:Transcript_18358/g.56992  ORF Transcript_18358/g.56992 Transcript_18358/m.56992 type:complete len:314 (+) Transcript_18358:594-1535(+)